MHIHVLVRLVLLSAAAFTLLMTHPAAAQPRRGMIAVADFDEVYTNYFKTRLASDQLAEMSDGINREKTRMQVLFLEHEKKFRDLRDRAMEEEISEAERTDVRTEADENMVEMRRLEQRIKEYNQSQQKLLDEQTRRIRGNLIEEIRERIRKYAIDNGILIIIDRSQVDDTGVPAILFRDDNVDITAEIINEINR
jgi:Skp family chaperone for outer membrane proteins